MPNDSTVSVYGVLSGDPFAKDVEIKDLLFQNKTVRGFWLATWLKQKSPQEYRKATQEVAVLIKDSLKSNIVK